MTLRDKAYQKLGKLKADSVNENSSLLLERKIKRYDARIDALKDQSDRVDTLLSLARDDMSQEISMLNSHLMFFSVLQGLILISATLVLLLVPTSSQSVDAETSKTCSLMILFPVVLGWTVSLVTLFKVWDSYARRKEIMRTWELRNVAETYMATTPASSSSEPLIDCHRWRRQIASDLILPMLLLVTWTVVLARFVSKFA